VRLACAVLVLAGCGRIAFDPLGDGGAGDATSDAASLPAMCGAFQPGWVLDPAVPIASLASTANDSKPFLLPDGLTLYFISDRLGTNDVFVARRSVRGGPFGTPSRVPVLSTDSDESGISLSDSMEAFITTNRPGSQNQDLWVAQYDSANQVFLTPQQVTGGANTASWEYEPSTGPDGNVVYYVTENYAGFPGGGDPVFTSRQSMLNFTAPQLVAPMASVNNEYGFTVSANGLVAMVASDRDGAGTSFIFVSVRPSTAVGFPTPSRMPQLEVSTDQGHAVLSVDGCEILFGAQTGTTYQLYVARWRQP